jgi:dienelactone hydrolase
MSLLRPRIQQRLDSLVARHEQMLAELGTPEALARPDRVAALQREIGSTTAVVTRYREYTRLCADLDEHRALAAGNDDLADLARAELPELEARARADVDALIDLLIKQHRVDPKRVYMTGGSNGAMMMYVYAVKRAEKLAAIAPIVGAMFTFDEKPSVPLPILMINGAKDNEVPLEGGMSRNRMVSGAQGAPFKSLSDTIDFWVKANRSEPKATVVVTDGYTTTTHAATPGGAPTVSIVDSAGGHGWPGTPSNRAENTPIQSFNGAEKVWAFLKDHRRP